MSFSDPALRSADGVPGRGPSGAGDRPEPISLEMLRSWIVFEDENLLAVNKPGEVVCHPSKNGPWSSLVGACREYAGLERIHLVHRLDRETSGLVLLAKNRAFARRTQMALQERKVRKEYLAIVEGEWIEARTIRNRLAKDIDSPVYIKQAVRDSRSAQMAETAFSPLYSSADYSLVRVIPVTGRKHQIRVHAAWAGHPLAGDKIYGPDERLYLEFISTGWSPALAERLPLRRQALHASRVFFDIPGMPPMFVAPLPEDMRRFLAERTAWTGAGE